jgi:CheY-like chemotaxis protein
VARPRPRSRFGRSAFEFIHPDDLARVQQLFARLLQLPGGTLTAEYRSRHKDGSWLWVETFYERMHPDDRGRTRHAVERAISDRTGYDPDVVVCDIGLPGLDGYGVARELRLNPTTARVRLLALTGYGQEEDRRRSRGAGFDHHLVKPADPEELRRLLASG